MSGPATLTGNTLALDGAGTVTIRASQPGDSNRLAATPVDRSFTVAKAAATVTLANLDTSYDGQPKTAAVTTIPAGLDVIVTYNGSATPPTTAGSYTVSATVDDPDYQGSAAGTLVIGPRSHTADLTGWDSNIAGKVTGGNTSSPLLNPNDTTDSFSTNTLQARFGPLTLSNTGDKVTLSGGLQLTLAAVAGQGNWFRFGLYDNRNQASNIATGWLGYTGMGNSLYERTGSGLFSTGNSGEATQRTPDGSPTPVSSTSPAGNPPLAFEVTATRTATGVVITHFIKRTDTNTTLMSYTYTDTTPNNNGLFTGSQTTATGYSPTYNAAGFAFSRGYIGTTGTQAQFSNVRVTYTSAAEAASQTITFDPLSDRVYGDAPFALTATTSSGLPVSYTVVSGPAMLSGDIVTVIGVGDVTIRASQAGDFTRLPAMPVEQTFSVGKAPATVTLANLMHTYNGSAKSATATTVPANLTVDLRYNGEQTAPYQIGNHEVTAVITDELYEGSASGTLVIEAIPQTITFDPLPDRTFGDAAFALSANSDSGLPVSFSIVSGPATLEENTLTLTGAGTVTVRASQAGDATRAPAADVDRSFSVAKATATVTLGDLSATYDGTSKAFSAVTHPADLTVTKTYDGTSTEPIEAGIYPVTATIVDDNYQGSASDTLVILDARTGLENWRFDQFGTYENTGDAADSADPDSDGIKNLMEFALGLDPELPSTIPATLVITGGTMKYAYTRLQAAVAELDFTVEWSDDLTETNWTVANQLEISPPTTGPAPRETVTATIPEGTNRRFMRLKVSNKAVQP